MRRISHLSRRTRLCVAAALGVVLAAFGFWASAIAAGPELTFDWRMADRFGDINGDGVVDELLTNDYVNPPTGWKVSFDACASPAATSAPAGSTYQWRFTKGTTTVTGGTVCRVEVNLPTLGTWNVSSKIISGGTEFAATTSTITPVDKLIVSLGDSIGSGEGNPDTIAPGGSFPFYTPVWADKECHRSSLAGSAQAALRLERRDPHSAVTFVHLACSGATVLQGLLGEYEGQQPDPSDGNEPPQLQRALDLTAGRNIDALFVSIGANDAKFSEVVKTCLVVANCHTAPLPNPPGNAQQQYDRNIQNLPSNFAQLETALDGPLASGKVANVYFGEYFDPSTKDDGAYCAGTTLGERESNTAPDAPNVDGVSAVEWQFASETLISGINAGVVDAVEKSDDDGGKKWKHVPGIKALFKGPAGHGYCAVDRWTRTLVESLSIQQGPDGAFHPNSEGHLYAIAKRFEEVAGPDLGIGGTPLPFTPDPASEYAATGMSDFVSQLDALNFSTLIKDALAFHAGVDVDSAFSDAFEFLAGLQQKLEVISNDASGSITKLDNLLDDIDGNGDPLVDAAIPGIIVDVSGSIGPHAPALKYDIELRIKVTVDKRNPTLAYLIDGMALNGSTLDGALVLDNTVRFTLEPKLPEIQRFKIPHAGVPLGTLSFNVSADLGNTRPDVRGDVPALSFTAGIANVTATGTLQAGIGGRFTFKDPNGDGVIDATELSSPGALFDVSCVSTGAQMDLRVKSSLAGLSGPEGKITLNDPDLCDGLATPEVALGDLSGLRQITAQEIINGIAQLSTLVSTLQASGDIDLPFIEKGLKDLVKVNQKLVKFFVDNGLTDPAKPMENISIPENQRALLDTIEEIVPKLATALGVPAGSLNLRWESGRLLFDLTTTVDLVAGDTGAALDFEDQLANAGLTGLVAASGSATVGIDAAFSTAFSLGIDLNPGLAFDQRFFIKTGAGPELSLDAPLTADIDLDGKLTIVDVSVTDANAAGTVPLLRRRITTTPMLTVNIDGKGDDRLTLAEAVQAVADAQFPVTIAVNAEVPSTTLTALLSISGQELAAGTVTIAWPNVTVLTGAMGLQVTTDARFRDFALPLAFDLNDPRAALGEILNAVRSVIVAVQEVVAENPALEEALPLAGKSAADIDPILTKLTSTLDQIIAVNDSLTLDNIEAAAEKAIGEALGLAQSEYSQILTLRLEPAVVGTGAKPAALTAEVNLGICTDDRTRAGCVKTTTPEQLPFNLALGGGDDATGIFGLNTAGNATLSYDATAKLVAGLELPTVAVGTAGDFPVAVNGEVTPFIRDDSSFDLGVGVAATGVVTANLGPAEVSLGRADNPATADVDEADPVRAELGARFRLAKASPTQQRLPVGSAALDSFLASLPPTNVHPAVRPTCGGQPAGTPALDACAKLPVYLVGEKLGEIAFRAPDLLSPAGWTWDGEEGVIAAINPEKIGFSLLIQGMDALAERLQDALGAIPPGQTIPLLGTDPAAGVDVIQKFRTGVLDPLQTLVNQLTSAATVANVDTRTRQFFVDNVGPASEVKLLRNANNDQVIDGADITLEMQCDHSGVIEACVGGDSVTKIERMEVVVPMRLAGETTSPALDLGFPGLRLGSTEGVMASAGFDLDLAFGIDKTDGFYIPTGRSDSELSVFAEVALPNDASGPDMNADLVFLPITVEDRNPGPDVRAAVDIDVAGGGTDGRLTLQQLDTIEITPTVQACANVDLGVEMSVPVDESTGRLAPSSLPKVVTNLVVAGGYDCMGDLGAPVGTGLTIQFRDVGIDPGALFRDFIGPVAKEIRRYTGPIEPVVDAIRSDIPGIDVLAKKAGQTPPKWIELLEAVNQLNVTAGGQDGLQVIKRIIQLVDLVEVLDRTSAYVGGQPALIPIGTFSVDIGMVSKPVPNAQAGSLVNGTPTNNTSILSRLGDVTSEVQTAMNNATGPTGGLKFPVLEQPTMLFQLLVGKDVPLVVYDAGLLKVQRAMSFSFQVGPVNAYISGSASVEGRFVAGYDTYGLRQAIAAVRLADPGANIPFSIIGGLVQGFYIDDLDAKGVDVPEIVFKAELTAGVALGVEALSVGIEGGVIGRIDLNIRDDDGKLRFLDIKRYLQHNPNPLCMFNASMKLEAVLRFVLKTPVGNKYEDIANATIFEDPDITFCEAPPPPLATYHASDGSLELNATGFDDVFDVEFTAANRLAISTPEVAVQTYPNVNKVYANMSSGRDVLTIRKADGVTTNKPVVLCGGGGNDVITTAVPATVWGDGGGSMVLAGQTRTCTTSAVGKDRLVGSPGADTIDGAGNDDAIFGGAGNDTLRGGNGDDVLQGNAGNDSHDGGVGRDTIDYSERTAKIRMTMPGPGGEAAIAEADTTTAIEILIGGAGPDELTGGGIVPGIVEGGPGDDILRGGDLNDVVLGGEGKDRLGGDIGTNHLYGGPGDDTFAIGPGGDTMVGEAGVDRVDYSVLPGPVKIRVDGLPNDGQAADVQDNVAEVDIIVGTAMADQIVGGSKPENLYGRDGNDRIDGGAGDDELRAGLGDDGLEGGAGNDILDASDGADGLSGGSGNDLLLAYAGNDTLRGGTGDDEMLGGLGNDLLVADPGGDVIDGGGGSDTVDYSGRLDPVRVDVSSPGCDGDDAVDAGGPAGCSMDDVRGTVEIVLGGMGADVLVGDSGDDRLVGGDGNDRLSGNGGKDRLEGGLGNDVLFDRTEGTTAVDADADRLEGGAGNDGLVGHGGADVLMGDAGDDHVRGGPDRDVVRGGTGRDILRGGGGDDNIQGEDGDDFLDGGAGNDVVFGNVGNDALFGGAGADTVDGGDGDDVLTGWGSDGDEAGDGNDLLRGQLGVDRLYGGGGADDLQGGEHNDFLLAGDGNDRLDGGNGRDQEYGELGDDTFFQGTVANGGDWLYGGDGTADKVDYSRRTGTITVRFNELNDDGAVGEKDYVDPDIELFSRP